MRSPDLVVVVLDCGRADDLPGGLHAIPGMPFLEGLARESLRFPQAVAPSPWTIPSHAGLFTGLYPWESGAHLKRRLFLEGGLPTLAERLGSAGYATLSASANGFISPTFGLVRGFRSAAWGDWWERFLRLPGQTRPPWGFNFGPTLSLPRGRLWEMLEGPARYANRRPLLLDVVNRIGSRLVDPERSDGAYSPHVSSWIEPSLEEAIGQVPRSQPLFLFVNYYEAHEPYVIDPSRVEGGMGYRRLAQLRMDRTNFLAGRWSPTPREFEDLRRLSRAVVRSLDERVRRLVGVLQRAGRWDRTLFVLTSDHGQAFGERGFLFHGVRLWDAVVRIPLWVRWPEGQYRGEAAKGMASLVDLMPTLLQEAGAPVPPLAGASPLTGLVDRPREGPVFSMSDGTPARRTLQRMVPRRVWEPWDQAHLAGYQGPHKLIYNVETRNFQAFDLDHDPGELHPISEGPEVPRELLPLARRLEEHGRRIPAAPAPVPSSEVDERLRSWGYE